ncbi:MAG: phosphate acyltransferase [Candidatus Eisenbacteria bacterium]
MNHRDIACRGGPDDPSPGLPRLSELPDLLGRRAGGAELRGAVLAPGQRTLEALERFTALLKGVLTVSLTAYASPCVPGSVRSELGRLGCKLVEGADSVERLSRWLSGTPGTGGEKGTRLHFILAGDGLRLEDVHVACSSAPGSRTFSHVAVLDVASFPRCLLVTDGLVNARPDVETRLGIIRNAVSVSQALGNRSPKVALLAAVEQVHAGVPVTVESAEITKMSKTDRTGGAIVEGPLSFDVALVQEVAEDKGARGPVAGRADVLVGSSVEVANGVYAALVLMAGAASAGVVVGPETPLVVPFPYDSPGGICNSICLASLIRVAEMD